MNDLTNDDVYLSPQQLAEVRRILAAKLPGVTVWAFGSRVTGGARKYSDLDLALITDAPLLLSVKADLVACFEESSLPFKVDLVDWASTSDSFRKIIMTKKIVIHEGQPPSIPL